MDIIMDIDLDWKEQKMKHHPKAILKLEKLPIFSSRPK